MQGKLFLTDSYPLIFRLLTGDLRVFAFGSAVLLYAFLGSATPDVLSWVELSVGALLVLALMGSVFDCLQSGWAHLERWYVLGLVCLIYGLMFGVLGGVVSGHSVGDIVRDILPFGFLFLPLFLLPFVRRDHFSTLYLLLFCLLGGVFAVRAAAPVFGLPFDVGYAALYYLGNSPAVLFVVLFSLGCAIEVLSRGISVKSVLWAVLFFAVCAIAVLPMVMTAQRASMGAILVYAVFIFGVRFVVAPRRMILVLVGFSCVVFGLFGGFIDAAFQDFADKSRLVGANMRFEEWAAVWGEVSGNVLTLLFGQGWGASFSSPAVADIEVRYTHSLLSSMLLKTGLVGFVLCAAYIGALVFALLRVLKGREVIVFAILAPLIIDVFLYAAYKSLDFGLLLGLIPMVIFHHSQQSRIASAVGIRYENHKGVT